MTKDELQAKRAVALSELKNIEVALCLDEHYIDIIEKENAELKGLKDVATLIRANNDTVVTLMQLNNKLVSKSQQLTKAIKIIKELVRVEYADFTDGDYSNELSKVLEQAERFLKEIEK